MTLRGVLVLIGAIVLLGVVNWVGWTLRHNAGLRGKAAEATGTATLAQGQSAAAADASAIRDRADSRERQTIIIRERNREAIQTAPGADARLDPELVRRTRVGLCKYRAYAGDAECAAVRPADPAVLPPAGAAGGAVTP